MPAQLRRAFVVGAAGAWLGACGQAGSRPLFAADTHPADYPTVNAVKWFADEVARRTGGELTIRQYPGGQLGEEKDTLELTIFGGVDINRVNLAPLNAIAPETQIPSLPFIFRSEAHLRRAMLKAPGKAIAKSLEKHGLVGLCFYESGARSFYCTKRNINTPQDLRGLKIRVPSSELFVAMVETLGGDATPMSFGEVYGALLQGVVDGAENNWPSYESTRHFEAAKFYSLTRHVMAPEVLVMSLKRWKKLTQQHQEVLVSVAEQSVGEMERLWALRETEAEKRVRAAGVIVTQPEDRSAFEKAMEPVWARFLTTPQLRRLSEDVRAEGDAA